MCVWNSHSEKAAFEIARPGVLLQSDVRLAATVLKAGGEESAKQYPSSHSSLCVVIVFVMMMLMSRVKGKIRERGMGTWTEQTGARNSPCPGTFLVCSVFPAIIVIVVTIIMCIVPCVSVRKMG